MVRTSVVEVPMKSDPTDVLRVAKAMLTAAAAIWSLMVALDNVFDYQSNFLFVRHVLEMDTTSPGNSGAWRAVRAPLIQHAAYALVIVTQFAVGALTGCGAVLMVRNRKDGLQFKRARTLAVMGLTLGIILWLVGFEVIAGEWFMMWQSHDWNAQEAAFRFVAVYAAVLIFVSLDEGSTSVG